jgi:hypothetical protein
MPERPRIYHGHYCVFSTQNGSIITAITMEHPLEFAKQFSAQLINWLPISGLEADWLGWGWQGEFPK